MDLGFSMAIRFRARLGASILAATLFALPVTLAVSKVALAENNEDIGQSNKKKKSQAPLAPAVAAGKVVTTTEIVAEKNYAPMLSETSAASLQTLADRYRDIAAQGGFPKVPKGTYKKGGESKGIAALNKRLFMEGYLRVEATQGEFASRMTSATIDALARFQRNVGLAATGAMDGPTIAALNVPAEQRLRTIEANIPRLQAYGENLGDRYLVVNVPGQQIETVQGGRVYSRHNAIVGRPERPTPVVMTALSDVNFNPYWNTPPSIIERDLFPKMRSGTKILEDMNIRVFQGFGGPEVDPDSVDWGSAVADDYHFRQEPGPQNAMATAKINFPSPFGIYLHDTPEKHLFKSGQRFYSSGCVRVEKVDLLLQWVLNGQEGIGSSEITALAETLERRDVKLEAPPQLRVTYMTAWPVGNTVAFRPDVYDLDSTGFVVGQPMPVGEVADDGQRFVLKPIPRKASSVDADEAEGFGLFGGRSAKPGQGKAKSKSRLFNSLYGENNGDFIDKSDDEPKKVSGVVTKKPAVKKASAFGMEKTADKKKVKRNKDVPGLFDWAAYRKEQKLGLKKTAEPAVKKQKKKPAAVKEAAADPAKDKVVSSKKKPEDKKVVAKKLDDKDTKKVAAVEPKATEKVAAKPVDKAKVPADAKKKPASDVPAEAAKKKPAADAPVEAAKKKPAADAPKKVADNCKPDAAGKLPKDCKPAPAKKP